MTGYIFWHNTELQGRRDKTIDTDPSHYSRQAAPGRYRGLQALHLDSILILSQSYSQAKDHLEYLFVQNQTNDNNSYKRT